MKSSKLLRHRMCQRCWLPRYLLVSGKLRLLKGQVALKTSAGWQASWGRATVPLLFFKDTFVFRNLLSFNLTVTLSTCWDQGEGQSLGYVKVQENVSPTAVNQALGSHVEVIQTSLFSHISKTETMLRLSQQLSSHTSNNPGWSGCLVCPGGTWPPSCCCWDALQ